MTIKNILPFFFAGLIACSPPADKPEILEETVEITYPEKAKDFVMYEVNVRQYTEEGTFKAFQKHLPRLAELGVDMLWFMPIQPIGKENRKGTLGSYYSIQDYAAVNPEFGNMDDFKAVVDEAHELGMTVILDWVANHTAWDHAWLLNTPEYYTHDSTGNIIPPVADWKDVADLNYDNQDMRNAMIADMLFWVKEANIDGFRCDVANEVPMDFWNVAKDSLDQIKDVFMLAEADVPEMHDDAFYMTYGWGLHHRMNEIAKGHHNADSLRAFLQKDTIRFAREDFKLNFITNHDENSWNGTIEERMGAAGNMFAVFSYTFQGMPLIYSGQEAGLNKRLDFFEKDQISWDNLELSKLYKKLNDLKANNPALWAGKYGGIAKEITSDNANVYAFTRSADGNTVIAIFNMSAEAQTVNLEMEPATYNEYFTGDEIDLGATLELGPWAYLVFEINE